MQFPPAQPDFNDPRGVPPIGHAPTSSDEELLDQFFEDATSALQDGREITPGAAVAGRDDLASQLERLADLARFVVASRIEQPPRVHGYAIVSELGRGGMAVVYLARQESLGGRAVALKVLPRQASLSPVARERFRAETLAIARQKHPGIVPVYGVVDDGATLAYAMEWVDGRTLEAVITRVREGLAGGLNTSRDDRRAVALVRAFAEPLAEAPTAFVDATYSRLIARIGRTAAHALHAVHLTGLLHRDVKPSNLLLRRDGAVLLSDFGLARELDGTEATIGESFLGTAPYASPEQLRGRRDELDARSDVYSLGAAMYHALAFHAPYVSRSPVEVLTQVESVGPRLLRLASPGVAEDLTTIVAKAMDPEPARRYQTAGALADDLDRFLSDRPVLARPPSIARRAWKFVRRNRRHLIWASAAALIVATLSVVLAARMIWMPRWGAVEIDRARTILLQPSRADGLYNIGFFEHRLVKGNIGERPDLVKALRAYTAGLRWDPSRSDARGEKCVVEYLLGAVDATARLGETPTRPPGGPDRHDLRAVEDYLRAPRTKLSVGAIPADPATAYVIEPPRLDGLDATQLRLLGLAAFLLSDGETAVRAWGSLEQRGEVDPFVDGALGLVMLVQDRPAPAYARLREAMRAFPDVGFLALCTADAAMRCGDFVKARHYLDLAESLPDAEPRGVFRVRLLLDLASGDEEALQRYWETEHEGDPHWQYWNSVLAYQVGQYLLRQGRTQDAVHAMTFAVANAPMVPKVLRTLAPVVEHWWADLPEAQRLDFCRRAMRYGKGTAWERNWETCLLYIPYRRVAEWPVDVPVGDGAARQHLRQIASRFAEVFGAGPDLTDNSWVLILDPDASNALAGWLLTGEGTRPPPPAR